MILSVILPTSKLRLRLLHKRDDVYPPSRLFNICKMKNLYPTVDKLTGTTKTVGNV